jgi:putative peptidoglycan lipid II flippase
LFGVSGIASAFMFGFQVPNLFRRLFGEGALTAAFIPIYTELRQDDPALARRFASACMGGLTVLLGAVTLLGELILGGLLAWGEWTPTSVMAIELMMVMLPYMPLVCLVAVIGGILQVHGRFGPTASAPVLLNMVMIAAAIIAGTVFRAPEPQPQGAYLIGASVVAAGVIQLVWQAVALLSHERFTRRFQGVGRPVGELWRTMVPMMLGLAVFQINTAFDTFIAFALSFKEGGSAGFRLGQWYVAYPMNEGAVAALTWAQRLYQFPLGVFGIAVATAIFPALAAAAAQRRTDGGLHYQAVLHQGLRLTFFIGLPASAGLILIRLPLARMAFQYGRFDLDDAHRVAAILAGYATAVWAYSMTHVVTRAFYAVKDSRTPLRITMFNLLLNVTLNLTLIWPLGAAGLAWSTALCAMWQAILLLRAVRRYVAQPVDRTVWIGWARTLALTLVMTAALGAALAVIDTSQLSRRASALVLMGVVGTGAAIFILGAWVTGADELRWLLHRRGRGSDETVPS